MDAPQLHSPSIERALLGSLLIDSDVMKSLDITADDFHIERHRWIFEAIDTLLRRHEAVDSMTVCAELDKRKRLAEVGGPAFVIGLYTSTPTSYNAPSYAGILREKTRRRRLLQLANQIAKAATDENLNIDATIPSFVNSLVCASSVAQGARPISEAMSELYDEVEARMKNLRDIWGIPTGFPTFDFTTGGLQKGEVMVLAGMPGVGKSILGNDLAAGMGKCAPGVIYSMEMKRKQVARRLVSGRAEIPTRDLKTGRVREDQAPLFTAAIEYFSSLPIHISDSQGWTTTSLRADMARLKAQFGIEWFLLDYLYLLKDGEGRDENERTMMASQGLKHTAMELDLAGIVIHSLNKSGMGSSRNAQVGADGLPNGLDDLRGSGQVAYDADLACFLTRYNPEVFPESERIPARFKDNARVLWFGKGRELENPRQYVTLIQKPGFPAFGEYAPEKDEKKNAPRV